MNTSHKSAGRHYHIGSGRYVISGEVGTGTCAADDNPAAANNIWNCPGGVFEWGTGLERWDQYYYAKYDNNSYVNIESPVKLKYTFTTTDDQNTAFTSGSPFLYVWKKENVDGSGYRNNTFTNTDATAYPAQFDGKSFLLQYEGAGNLQGLPNRNTDNDWLKLINPKSGTQVIDADNSSKGYVLKAVGTGMMLAKHGTATACDSMSFEFDATNIPSVTEKTLPQFTFDSKPTIDTISVQHGVEQ